jgi:hypothetical protein
MKIKKIICFLFNHKPKEKRTSEFIGNIIHTYKTKCERCGCDLFGSYEEGKITKEKYWVYVKI